jgi:diguanylate cyclase (GGDEF)-like protein/PAS domain S-box-containing protein
MAFFDHMLDRPRALAQRKFDVWSLKTGKFVFFGAMCVLLASAGLVSSLIAQRQEALRQVSRYNICWLASQANGEFNRLAEKVAAANIPGSGVDLDDVALRYDVLVNRVSVMDQGDFRAFAELDPDNARTVREVAAVVARIQPMIDRVDKPGVGKAVLALMSPLEPKLVELAASANRYGSERVTEDQRELVRLFWIFSAVVGGLFTFGTALLLALGWHNRQLLRAHDGLNSLARDLRQASEGLEAANAEVGSINAQLHLRNEVLQRRDREIGIQNARFDAALNNMSQALCMVDAAERLVVCNQRFADLFALSITPVPGILFSDLVERSREPHLKAALAQHRLLQGRRMAAGFVQDGDERKIVSVSHQPMPDGGWVATYEDITQRRRDEAQITYLAHHDGLTGLLNRFHFGAQLETAIAANAGGVGRVTVVCLDLDGFKNINDSFGHHVGDALLREVGRRLAASVRDGDLVARLGGDEFAVLQVHRGSVETESGLPARLLQVLSERYDIDGLVLFVTASIGTASAPPDGATGDELMKNADLALYQAKLRGKNQALVFEPDMDAARQARRALEIDLSMALTNGEFEVFFQPLIDARRVSIVGFEALLRWRHPLRGLVSPAVFIPVAEEIGLISELGAWVLGEACAQAARWPRDLSVAVNLSPAQFRSRDLVGTVKDALLRSGLKPTRLELEITESVLLSDSDGSLAALHELRSFGIRIAMDDFGTGYSSLSYLRRFPFDKIKIDQSFVREMSTRPDCIKIVRSIAALGASLGMTTTAEGVETPEQFAQLQSAGCDQVQGYHFGRPEPVGRMVFDLPEPTRAAMVAA